MRCRKIGEVRDQSLFFAWIWGGEGISPINCQWEGRSIRILQSLKGESDKFYGDTNEILRPTRPPVTNNDRSLRLYQSKLTIYIPYRGQIGWRNL